MPDTTTRQPLDAALAALDSATSSDEMHYRIAIAALTVSGSTFAVVLVPERGQLRVAAAAGSVDAHALPALLTSPAVDRARPAASPTTASSPDALAAALGRPAQVWPVTSAGQSLAYVVLDVPSRPVVEDQSLLMSLLSRYAGSCLAHLMDTEVREDLLRQRGATIAALRRVADTDTLTGLANRAGLFTVLNSLLSRGQVVGVVYVDLDGFKAVNDEFDHEVGDEVLRTIADRLREVVRPTDLVGRLGGDEFLVIVRDTDLSGMTRVVQRIDDVMAQPVGAGQRRVAIGASCGVALADSCTSAQQLVSFADRAMYRRKRAAASRRDPSGVIDLDSRR